MLSMFELNELEEQLKMDDDKVSRWRRNAITCPINPYKHNWQPIAWSISDKSKHVNTFMCLTCFHEINVSECFENRIKLE